MAFWCMFVYICVCMQSTWLTNADFRWFSLEFMKLSPQNSLTFELEEQIFPIWILNPNEEPGSFSEFQFLSYLWLPINPFFFHVPGHNHEIHMPSWEM